MVHGECVFVKPNRIMRHDTIESQKTELVTIFLTPLINSSKTVVAGPHLLALALATGQRHKYLYTARMEGFELATHLPDLVQQFRAMKQEVEALKAMVPEP